MAEYNAAIALSKRPQYAEGTRLASPRDTRNNSHLWKKGQSTSNQVEAAVQLAQKTAREVAKMRRRVLGGGAPAPASSNTGWNYRGLYDPSGTYVTLDVVQFGSGTASGMYLSTIDNNTNSPDSGIGWVQVSTASGTWL